MILLSTIIGLINGIKVICVNALLAVSLCGKGIIVALEVIFGYASCFCHGLGVVFDEFQNFTFEQVSLLSNVKTLIDNIFHGVMKALGDLGNGIIDFIFHGKVQTKAIVTSMEDGIIGLFSLISKALIWMSETIVAVVVFFPQTAYRGVIKAGEITNYSSMKLTEFAVHVAKTVLRDIVSYSLAMTAIFLLLKYRRHIYRLGRNLLFQSIEMVGFSDLRFNFFYEMIIFLDFENSEIFEVATTRSTKSFATHTTTITNKTEAKTNNPKITSEDSLRCFTDLCYLPRSTQMRSSSAL